MSNYEWDQDEKSGRHPRLTTLLYDTHFMSKYTKTLFAYLTEEEEEEINRENERCFGLGDTFFTEKYLVFDRNLFRYEDILVVDFFRWTYYTKNSVVPIEAEGTYIALFVKDHPRTLFRKRLKYCHVIFFPDKYDGKLLDNFFDELLVRCGEHLIIKGPHRYHENRFTSLTCDALDIDFPDSSGLNGTRKLKRR